MAPKKCSEDHILHWKLDKCMLHYTSKVFYLIFQDLYFVHPESDKGNLDLNSFNIKLRKKSLIEEKKFECTDYFEDYKTYNNFPGGDGKHDLLFSFHILEEMKDHFISLDGVDCKYGEIFEHIKLIKNIRNKLTYCYPIGKGKSENYKDDLLASLKHVCDTMYLMKQCFKTKTNYKNLFVSVNEEIEKLWNHDLSSGEVHEIRALRDENKLTDFVCECRKELIKVYEIINPSPLFFVMESDVKVPVETIFVPVPLRVNGRETVNYNKILSKKIGNQNSSVVVVSADAGHGKTTLCKKLTKEWCDLSNTKGNKRKTADCHDLSNYDLVLLVEVKRAKEKGLYQYLKEILLQKSLEKFDEFQVMLFLKQLNVLIIIDAFDEKSKQAEKLINDVLQELNDKKFLITTRPYCRENIFTLNKKYDLHYIDAELLVFGNKEEKEFIRKVWDIYSKHIDSCGHREDYLKYIEKLPEDIRTAMKIPLINILHIYVWMKNREKGENLTTITFTALYTQILTYQRQTIKDKILSDNKTLSNEALESMIDDMIAVLAKHFYENLIEKGYSQEEVSLIDHSVITKMINSLASKKFPGVDLHSCCQKLLSSLFVYNCNVRNMDRSSRNKTHDHYEILHRTQMEYFVALHAVSFFENVNSHENMQGLMVDENKGFVFTIGLLCIKDKLTFNHLNNVVQILKAQYLNYNFLWSVLYETFRTSNQDTEPKPSKKLCYELNSMLSSTGVWRLNEKNVLSALNLIHHTNVNVRDMEIFFWDKNPDDIGTFYMKLDKLMDLRKKEKPTLLNLNFEKTLQTEVSCDKYLTCLENWVELKKFHGCLDTKGISLLKTHPTLVELITRIKSIEALNMLNEVKQKMTKSKWFLKNKIHLIFNSPLALGNENQYHHFMETKNLTVEFNCVNPVKTLIDMLMKMTAQGNFTCIILKTGSMSVKETKKLCLKLKNLIHGKLHIKSDHVINEEEHIKLENELDGVLLRWNC